VTPYWRQTHTLEHAGERLAVMLCANCAGSGPAYTWDEWADCVEPRYALGADGHWTFDGLREWIRVTKKGKDP